MNGNEMVQVGNVTSNIQFIAQLVSSTLNEFDSLTEEQIQAIWSAPYPKSPVEFNVFEQTIVTARHALTQLGTIVEALNEAETRWLEKNLGDGK